VRNWLAEAVGKDTAEVLVHGLGRAAGVEIANRVGLDNMVPGTRIMADKRALKDKIQAGALDSLGPVAGAAGAILTGAGQIMDGDVLKGLEKMLPIAPLRNVAKAAELAGGSVTDAKGNRIPVAVSGWDVADQLMGFTPRPLAERSEALYTINTNTRLLEQAASQLRTKWYQAIEQNDLDKAHEVQADIVTFNASHPEFAIFGLAQGYARRQKVNQIAEKYGPGVGVSNAKQLPRLNIGKFANIADDED